MTGAAQVPGGIKGLGDAGSFRGRTGPVCARAAGLPDDGKDADASQQGAPRLRQKCRLHFHELMLRVHQRMHALQQSRPRVLARSRQGLPIYL